MAPPPRRGPPQQLRFDVWEPLPSDEEIRDLVTSDGPTPSADQVAVPVQASLGPTGSGRQEEVEASIEFPRGRELDAEKVFEIEVEERPSRDFRITSAHRIGDHRHHEPTKREQAYFPAITATALRLLKATPDESVPELVIDAILRVSHRQNHSTLRTTLSEAYAELHKTSARRRAAFWRVAESLRQPTPEWRKMENPWQIEMLGYAHGLQFEDIDALLGEGLPRNHNDRRLGINTSLAFQQAKGAPSDLLEKIKSAAALDPVANEAYEAWMQPKQPSVEHIEAAQHLKELEAQNAVERDKRDQSWINFVRDIRADPARIARLKISTAPGVSSDLLKLWQLLRGGPIIAIAIRLTAFFRSRKLLGLKYRRRFGMD